MRTETDAQVMMPRADVFQQKHAIEQSIINPGVRFFVFEKTEYPPEGGIHVWYKGMPYPMKGFPFPEAVYANDLIKRMSRIFINMLGKKDMVLPLIGFAVLPYRMKIKIINRFLSEYCRLGSWIMSGVFLAENRYSNMPREMRTQLENFLIHMNIGTEAYDGERNVAAEFSKIIATIIEYDNAYRYRIEDILTETSVQFLYDRPFREIRRLGKLAYDREQTHAKTFIKSATMILSLAMLHPKIRKAFKTTVANMSSESFARTQLDNADRYHVLLRGDYNFTGRTFEERKKLYIDVHTHSKCCDAHVIEKKVDKFTHNGNEWETVCKKCFKKCEWTQVFPPEVEIAQPPKP